jgi:hypothetical protein
MIYLIITTCIKNKWGVRHAEIREKEYKMSIQTTMSLLPPSIKPILVENNSLRSTFLDSFGIPVHYTNNNSKPYWHKGCNELDDIQSVIAAFNIQDDDTIIKLTGRYNPITSRFFKTVIDHESEFDGFIKFFNVSTKEFMTYDCVLGLFAIKAKYIKNINFNDTTRSPEVQFATHCRTLNICEIKSLECRCRFGDTMELLYV